MVGTKHIDEISRRIKNHKLPVYDDGHHAHLFKGTETESYEVLYAEEQFKIAKEKLIKDLSEYFKKIDPIFFNEEDFKKKCGVDE